MLDAITRALCCIANLGIAAQHRPRRCGAVDADRIGGGNNHSVGAPRPIAGCDGPTVQNCRNSLQTVAGTTSVLQEN